MASFQQKASSTPSILPKQYQDFTNKQYWNQFFQELNERAFEWYGKCDDIYPVIGKNLKKDSKILMIGCGNSNLSSELYDLGFHNITNVDYSEIVIQEMIKKNQTSRPGLKWDIGDVTDLNNLYANEQFDLIIDKGTLDAIFSENTPELKQKSIRMFDEISRLVLKNHGIYVCISLAQDYILETLIEYFQNFWDMEVNYLTLSSSAISASSNTSSLLQPFLFQFYKKNVHSPSTPEIRVFMDPMGNSYSKTEFKYLPSTTKLFSYIQYIQDFHSIRHSVKRFEMNKFEIMHLWSTESSVAIQANQHEIPRYTLYILDANDQGKLSMAVFIIPAGREADYQFTSKDGLLDIAFQANCKRLVAVCCNRPFVYPKMKDLQDELSPIILSLRFSGMDDSETIPYMAVNEDRSWEVISQGDSKLSGIYIVEEKADEPEGEGDEDEEEEDDANAVDGKKKKAKSVYRRLIFLQNQQFVQTEIHLVLESFHRERQLAATAAATSGGGSGGKKKKNNGGNNKKKSSGSKSKGKKNNNNNNNTNAQKSPDVIPAGAGGEGGEDRYIYDYQYLDDHHKGFLLSLCLNGGIIPHASKKDLADRKELGCLLIGLGGGSLPMILQKYFPFLSITAIEIDEIVYDVAKQYFDFHLINEKSSVVIEDGIKFIHQAHQRQQLKAAAAEEKEAERVGKSLSELSLTSIPSHSPSSSSTYQVIILDVDCKDPSLGLSAPPKEFISNDTLYKLYSLLANDGMLLINTVARNKELLNQLIDRLKIIFSVFPDDHRSSSSSSTGGKILQLHANKENVNICLICMKNNANLFLESSSSTPAVGASKGKGAASTKGMTKNQLEIKIQVALEQSLARLLENAQDQQDSLQLKELVEKVQIL